MHVGKQGLLSAMALSGLTTWTSDGFQNRILQTEEIPQQPCIQNELCETRAWIKQATITCSLIRDTCLHSLCSRRRIVHSGGRRYVCKPLERAASAWLRYCPAHSQPD